MVKNQPASNPLMWGLLVAFLVAVGLTAWLTYKIVRDFTKRAPFQIEGAGPIIDSQMGSATNTPNALGTPAATIDPSVPLQGSTGPEAKPWDGASRVSILFIGLDYGDWSDERSGPSHSDTMILFTIDPLSKSIGWIHIPRDLWVQIPGFEYGKINTAYFLGQLYELPDGGPGLAIETVEQLLGVPINFYVQIDFFAFEKFIDQIGGIDLDIPAEIKVDPLGKHNTVILQPGKQTLSGPVALAYARQRYTEGGDFDRAGRQRQVILAIRDKILRLNMLPTLIAQAPILYNQLAAGIHTNMSLDQAVSLAWMAQQIPGDNLHSGVIGPEQVEMAVVPDWGDVLIPLPDAIRNLRDEIFTVSGPISPVAASGDPKQLMMSEAASVVIKNGSTTDGLAARTKDYLVEQGVNKDNIVIGNADKLYSGTTIVDYTGKPYTLNFLISLFGIQDANILSSFDPNSQVDVVVILGTDWANSNPMP